MRPSDQADPLVLALDDLAALACDDAGAVDALRVRLREQRLRVLVAGEAKRGKSTLVNALLGREVLPAGVTPLTALATTVGYGTDERVTAVFAGGRIDEFPLSALGDLVTERGNPGNAKHVSSVTVKVGAPLLARGVELVDTPGTGSVYAHDTAQAQAAFAEMDVAVFVLTADPPVSASERELMSQVARLSVAMFVVLNKADRLSAGELAEVADFTSEVAAQAAGRPVIVYPASARDALTVTGDAGFARFAADFTAYLEQRRVADLHRSVQGHARRIASSLRDEVVLTQRAAQMRDAEAADRVRAFTARLAAVRDRRRDAADLAAARSRRLLENLNEAADLARPGCISRVSEQLMALFDGMPDSRAAEIESAGRAKLAELAVAEAEVWRGEATDKLEYGLALLDERLTEVLNAELDAVRQAAADLLGLDLTVAAPARRLAHVRFFYQLNEPVGQTELLAGMIRRHLPGQAGRSRAREHVLREAATMIPQQIGRARADLQYRLAGATRHLATAVDARYQEGTGRLQRALDDAAEIRGAAAERVAVHEQRLASRLAAIDQVIAALDAAPKPVGAAQDSLRVP